ALDRGDEVATPVRDGEVEPVDPARLPEDEVAPRQVHDGELPDNGFTGEIKGPIQLQVEVDLRLEAGSSRQEHRDEQAGEGPKPRAYRSSHGTEGNCRGWPGLTQRESGLPREPRS